VVVNLHLETARRGLEGMLSPEGLVPDGPFSPDKVVRADEQVSSAENAVRFSKSAAGRAHESEIASAWARGTDNSTPLVIGGDFNLPVESTIFRDHWTQFTDAFENRGNGLGWSKREGRWLRIRIDHLLTLPNGVRPQRIEVGPTYQSDHLPVIGDFAWPALPAAPKR
jgi:hypothetical protein